MWEALWGYGWYFKRVFKKINKQIFKKIGVNYYYLFIFQISEIQGNFQKITTQLKFFFLFEILTTHTCEDLVNLKQISVLI